MVKVLPRRDSSGRNRGTGIAIKNVAERVERFYAVGSGMEIMSSKPGQGTCVTLKLAGAALQQQHSMYQFLLNAALGRWR